MATQTQYWITTEKEQQELDTEFVGPTSDHILRSNKNGKYYFLDEIGVDLFGPYDTVDEAKADLDKYAQYI